MCVCSWILILHNIKITATITIIHLHLHFFLPSYTSASQKNKYRRTHTFFFFFFFDAAKTKEKSKKASVTGIEVREEVGERKKCISFLDQDHQHHRHHHHHYIFFSPEFVSQESAQQHIFFFPCDFLGRGPNKNTWRSRTQRNRENPVLSGHWDKWTVLKKS